MDEHVAISGQEWLAEHGPRDEGEAVDVAHALIRRRQIVEDLERLEALTPFERELAERASRAARDAVISSIERAIGHTAATISAQGLRESLRHTSARLDFRPSQFPEGLGWSGDRVRAAELVTGAHKAVERMAGGPTP